MDEIDIPIATLILPDHTGLNTKPYLRDACNVLADHDGVPVRLLKDRVYGEDFIIAVTAERDGDFGPSITLSVLGLDGKPAKGDTAQWLLARLVKTAMLHSPFDLMSWIKGEDLIDRESFDQMALAAEITAWTSASQLQGLREELRQPRETEEQTKGATFLKNGEERAPADSRMGAAGWLMTGALAAVSAPVAIGLACFAAFRGMEFRLATQVVSITVLFVTLSNTEILSRFLRTILY